MSDFGGVHNTGEIGQVSIGGQGHTFNQTYKPGTAKPSADTTQRPSGEKASHPVNTLHAVADIVAYSRFNAGQQVQAQDRLAQVLDRSMTEAGANPATVMTQDHGDARFLSFPMKTNVARVLAVMPRHLNDELTAGNQDMTLDARLRIRLSFAMGPVEQGKTGLIGTAPITVERLSSAARFRLAMKAAPSAYLGVIMDDHLYDSYVRPGFRPDMNAHDYLHVHLIDPEKDFEAGAWIRLFGCSPRELATLLA